MLLKLHDKLTIASADELKATLVAALDGGGDILLDATAVEQIDLTGLQLLFAAHKTAVRNGKTFAFAEGAASEVIDLAALRAGFARDADDSNTSLWLRRSHEHA